jgi:hypothetical protein
MKGQLIVAPLPVLLEQHAAQHCKVHYGHKPSHCEMAFNSRPILCSAKTSNIVAWMMRS